MPNIKKNEPGIVDLFNNPHIQIEQEKLLKFLNQEPPSAWVKTHPYIKGYKYLPIDKVEFLLKTIFRKYKIERLHSGMLLNSVEYAVRVHYADPVTGEWLFHDGSGAQEIQTAKDTGRLKMDMSNINTGAVSMALPIAKTVAIKDACDHLGNIFGANLNRKTAMVFDIEKAPDPLNSRMIALINTAASISDLEVLKEHLKPELQTLFDEKWNSLKSDAAQ